MWFTRGYMKTIFIRLFGREAKKYNTQRVRSTARRAWSANSTTFRNAQLADVYRAMCANPETTIVVLPPFVRTRAERSSRPKDVSVRTKTVDLPPRTLRENGSAARLRLAQPRIRTVVVPPSRVCRQASCNAQRVRDSV